MKITEVKVHLLRRQLSSTMRISRGGFTQRQHTLVQVFTDAGITGIGEGIGNATLIKAILEAQLGQAVIGLDPFNIEHLRHKLLNEPVYFERKGSVLCALSALEMACWDIKGKALQIPCYQLLGGLCQRDLPAYASDIYWEESISAMADNARRIVNLGFKTVKAHIGYDTPEADTHRVRALREAIGPDIQLMIDLNAGYNLHEATRACQLWEPFNLTWLEEPLKPDLVSAMGRLREKSRIPIAAGENEFRIHGFADLFRTGAVDVAMPDIGRVGGLQEAKNICTVAEVAGIPVSPHNFSSGVLLAATMHLMASTPNTWLLEVDTSENAVYDELLLEPPILKAGCLAISDAPGLGVHLPAATLARYAA